MQLFRWLIIFLLSSTIQFCFAQQEEDKPVPDEQTFLFTDRTFYVGGEQVFYKFYVFEAGTAKPSSLSKAGYIVLRSTRSQSSVKIRVMLKDGIADGSFALPDTLSSGPYQLLAFTQFMRNSGEELFFHKELIIANRFDKSLDFYMLKSQGRPVNPTDQDDVNLQIVTEKQVYGIREKVTVNLKSKLLMANIAVSVHEAPPINLVDPTIIEQLNRKAIDEIKLVTGYTSAESKGRILDGRVTDAVTLKPVEKAIVLLSCPDSVPNMQYAVTDQSGKFRFLTGSFYDGKELFLTIRDVPADKQWRIEAEDEYKLSIPWSPTLYKNSDRIREYIRKSQDIVYINQVYGLQKVKTNVISQGVGIRPAFYHGSVTTVYPSDFESLSDFLEIAVEILPQLRIRKDHDSYRFEMMNKVLNDYEKLAPAIFLDGVYVDDYKKIILLGTEQIRKIDLIAERRAFGDLIFGGMIAISSRTVDKSSKVPATHSLLIYNDNPIGEYCSEVGSSEKPVQSHQPFVKQLLLWNPSIELDENGEGSFSFYTTDHTTSYNIRIEGVTSKGQALSAVSGFQVVKSTNNTGQ
jgi:hypothetical protein